MLESLREKWLSLGKNNQIILAASGIGAIIALFGFLFWAGKPDYAPLFGSLTPQDADAITTKLREKNVPFRLTHGGATIEVPSQQRDELRIQLLGQGLPQEESAKTGSSSADAMTLLTAPPEVQKKQMLQAAERELAKSIMTLRPVASAIIHIAPANDSPFSSAKQEASAAVILSMKAGQSLTQEQVTSILRLVQMSYTGLSEQKISIVDSQGALLHDPNRNGVDVAGDRAKQEIARGQAKRIELQSAIDKVYGPNKAVILVNLELNADQVETKQTLVEPGATVSQSATEETLAGNPPATPPGLNANNQPPGTPNYVKSDQNSGNFTSKTTDKKTQPSHTETHTVRAPGRIDKLTVSALIDDKVPANQVESIRQTLFNAIGGSPNDLTRVVTVAQVPFDRSEEENATKAAAAAQSADRMRSITAVALPLVLMLVCLFLLARALRRTQIKPLPGQLALAGATAGGGGLALGAGRDSAQALSAGESGEPNLALLEGGEEMRNQGQRVDSFVGEDGEAIVEKRRVSLEMMEEPEDDELEAIMKLLEKKPETVAMLLRSWTANDN